jgi:hypothetical protein
MKEAVLIVLINKISYSDIYDGEFKSYGVRMIMNIDMMRKMLI